MLSLRRRENSFITLPRAFVSARVDLPAHKDRLFDREGICVPIDLTGELRALGDAGKAREKLAQFTSAVKHAGLHSVDRAIEHL
jgi:hypothetical protein